MSYKYNGQETAFKVGNGMPDLPDCIELGSSQYIETYNDIMEQWTEYRIASPLHEIYIKDKGYDFQPFEWLNLVGLYKAIKYRFEFLCQEDFHKRVEYIYNEADEYYDQCDGGNFFYR